MSDTADPRDALRVLRRHQERREQGVPTLSVLDATATPHWHLWSASEGLGPPVRHAGRMPAQAWLGAVWPAAALRAMGVAGPPPRTEFERDAWRAAWATQPDVLRVVQWALGAQGTPSEEAELEALQVSRAVAGRLRPRDLPTLLVEAHGDGEPRSLLEAASRLCLAVPLIPVALSLSREAARRLRREPESRALALLREGRLPAVRPLAGPPVLTAEAPTGAPGEDAPPGDRRTPAAVSADPAVAHARTKASGASPGQARSADEELLSVMLETCPETRGLFTLNGTLPWRFGPRDVEVDLLCASLRIAVEVDGWHHLQGPEAYRRDRRKDVELQRRGYLVVRVLADDVRQDMERTLAIVRAAVADRRREGPP